MSALGVLLNESKIVRLKRNKTAIGENCKNCKRNFKGGDSLVSVFVTLI